MKVIIIIGIVIFSLNILADIIIIIGKLLDQLDQYEFDNSCVSVTIITDIFFLVYFILLLNQL
jgi:hypothetical protein